MNTCGCYWLYKDGEGNGHCSCEGSCSSCDHSYKTVFVVLDSNHGAPGIPKELGWYFWDETYGTCHGPFGSRDELKTAMKNYYATI